MVTQVTLEAMTQAEQNDCVRVLLQDLLDTAPADCAGAMVVVWDRPGHFIYQGSVPVDALNRAAAQVRMIADKMDMESRTRGT